jgi:hypothetical protein
MANGININPFRPQNTGQNLTIGVTSVSSSAIGTQTFAVRLSATGNCHVAIGRAAVVTDMLVKSTDPAIEVAVRGGETVSVIQDAASTGTLNVVEMTH